MGQRWLLTFNAGSSSLKLGLFELAGGSAPRLRGAVRDIGRATAKLELGENLDEPCEVRTVEDAANLLLDRLEAGVDGLKLDRTGLGAVGHRVVHGGDYFPAAVRIDSGSLRKLESLNHLAPLHNPPALAVIRVVQERFPGTPAAAEFDTAFFHELPGTARAYAIPGELARQHGIRRYGFHGLAHQYMSRQVLRRHSDCRRMVTLQLGQGCSAAALRDGRPVETSMGFTPVEGLVMGTRSGDIDAGILLFLAQQGHTRQDLEDLLNRQSGLLGLSGESDDVRRLLELESQQHGGARRALAAFCHRINKYLGAYAAVLGGLDAIAIGGGIGENSPVIRARICESLAWLGLEIDGAANAGLQGGGRISTDASKIAVHVIEVDEEPIIADSTREVLGITSESAGTSDVP